MIRFKSHFNHRLAVLINSVQWFEHIFLKYVRRPRVEAVESVRVHKCVIWDSSG